MTRRIRSNKGNSSPSTGTNWLHLGIGNLILWILTILSLIMKVPYTSGMEMKIGSFLFRCNAMLPRGFLGFTTMRYQIVATSFLKQMEWEATFKTLTWGEVAWSRQLLSLARAFEDLFFSRSFNPCLWILDGKSFKYPFLHEWFEDLIQHISLAVTIVHEVVKWL